LNPSTWKIADGTLYCLKDYPQNTIQQKRHADGWRQPTLFDKLRGASEILLLIVEYLYEKPPKYTTQYEWVDRYIKYGRQLQVLLDTSTVFAESLNKWEDLSVVEYAAYQVAVGVGAKDLKKERPSWVAILSCGELDRWEFKEALECHMLGDKSEKEIEKRWGGRIPYVDAVRNRTGGCFNGDAVVRLADNSHMKVSQLISGDLVSTEKGTRKIDRVVCFPVYAATPSVLVNGVLFSKLHPIFDSGKWNHASSLAPVADHFVDCWYNLELEGGATINDHSVWVNNMLVATLGKSIPEFGPANDAKWGTGYWQRKL